MTEFKDNDREIHQFRLRLTAMVALVFICFGLLVTRFVWLQVLQHDKFMLQAEDNRIALVPIVPNRGLIVDRNGVVLARNYSAYTLEINPSKLQANLESVIDELAKLVTIEQRDRRRFKRLLEESRSFASVPIRTRLTDDEVARFTAQRFRFPGVDVQARLFRQYPLGETASHVIGYIGRINQKEAAQLEEDDMAANYNGTEHIGKEGLEKKYESYLHGTTGYEQVERTAYGRAIRTLSRTAPTPGSNLILSVDIELQKVIEEAFGENRGALVAIEPSTGDVLAYVSRPGFDPNLFVDGIDSQSWNELNTSLDKPLMNRPLSGTYPPGSTFKPFMSLAALELGFRRPENAIRDPGFFMLGGHRFNDDKPGGHGYVDMYRSIAESCDTYYYQLGNEMGIDNISNFMGQFGFGHPTGIDLEHERTGVLPSKEWKARRFAKNRAAQKWVGGDTISVSIGQGFNNYSMIQLAHAVSTLANNGVVMKPHLVKIIEDGATKQRTLTVPKETKRIPLKQENIDFIKRAMVGVTQENYGTGRRAFAGAEYISGGKTGTAQVIGLKGQKYNAHAIDERHRDNALYVAFAPADNPKIALALIVENVGFGASFAAPIARKAIDYYLLGKRPKPKDPVPAAPGAPAAAPKATPPAAAPAPAPVVQAAAPAAAPVTRKE
ncbi:penicillin-binding protein 2 [Massilia sp. 9I]|uniref:penicillin-binding protein 2 n=1 Tax=Massilia sp. 9I TaxID=2653152 RepID=UPI0012F1DA2F|nr:penicillin-binding protein 2 [Massilia sp. 9I]VXB53232.1 transpeptidase involved in peptidoglycan synthesis (penicillin-binding protein 2) [Massilia sp. 9I]